MPVSAVTSHDVELVRAAYLAMELIVLAIIVPLALTSVLIEVIKSLGTPWGLFRHYWVLVKLLLTIIATAILLLETPPISQLADTAVAAADPRGLPRHAGALLRRPDSAAPHHHPVRVQTPRGHPVRLAQATATAPTARRVRR